MKKLCLLLLLCFLSVTTALADSPRFDNMRTVVIADTTQDSYAARFMKSRLKQPFRIPYWDRIETDTALSPSDVNIDTLRTLAAQYKADVVLVPVVQTWYWRQHMAGFWRYDDDEIITECLYHLTVYAYDKRSDTFRSYSDKGREVESASILNDPNEVLTESMDRIMKKLPYKRIPTDIEDIATGGTTLQTRTTEGGAKILTNTFPQAI
mgnify:FL=1